MLRRQRLLAPDTGSNPTSGNAQAANTGDTPAQAATHTSPDAPAADGQEPITTEEARKLRSEAFNLRKREKEALAALKTYQDAEQAQRDAQLPELERLQKQAAEKDEQNVDLASRLSESLVREEVADLYDKFNFVIKAKSVAKFLLMDFDAIEFEDGKPTNIEKLLEKLAKNEPDLVKKEPEQQQQRGAPALPANNPGRSSYTASTGNTPGKQPSWDQVKWSGR